MGSPIHSHIGHRSKELVHRDRIAQEDDHMVTYDRQFSTHLHVESEHPSVAQALDIIRSRYLRTAPSQYRLNLSGLPSCKLRLNAIICSKVRQ